MLHFCSFSDYFFTFLLFLKNAFFTGKGSPDRNRNLLLSNRFSGTVSGIYNRMAIYIHEYKKGQFHKKIALFKLFRPTIVSRLHANHQLRNKGAETYSAPFI